MHLQRLTCLWPGLPKLWYAGDRVGLGIAIAFSLAGNVLLFVSFQGSETAEPTREAAFGNWLGWFWVLFLAVWIGCVVKQAQQTQNSQAIAEASQAQREAQRAAMTALFQDAQLAYLGRNWLSAETLVRSLLHDLPSDLESRLLLVSVLRQTERFDEALAELNRIEETDGSSSWLFEVRRERQRIEDWREEADANVGVGDRSESPQAQATDASARSGYSQANREDSESTTKQSLAAAENTNDIDTHPLPRDSSNGGESNLSNHTEDEALPDSTGEFGNRSSSQAA